MLVKVIARIAAFCCADIGKLTSKETEKGPWGLPRAKQAILVTEG